MNATTATPEPCDRTIFNQDLERRALRILDPADPCLAWIFHGRNGHLRHGVLVQLGHIAEHQGDDACLAAARAVCTPPTPKTTRDGEALLRRRRLDLPDPQPATTSDDFEVALQVALCETFEDEPAIGLAVFKATVNKFAAELGELVELLRAAG